MDELVISLRECMDGWRVFQGERPLFWFPDYPPAIETARMVASVQADIREASALIEMRLLGEPPVHVATCAPAH